MQKKLTKKYQVYKKIVFHKTQESRFKFYLNFILRLLSLQLGLLWISYIFSKNFGIVKVKNKYV
jgi:hypothetical protein